MKHRLRTPLYELLRSWQMPMVKAVNICKETEQLCADLATFHNPPMQDVINALGFNELIEARKYGIKI